MQAIQLAFCCYESRSEVEMSEGPRFRSRMFYRIALGLPIAALLAFLVTGRFQEYWRMFSFENPPSDAAFSSNLATAFIWSLATLPLLFAAWEIGRQHTASRRLGTGFLLGLRTVVRLALGRGPSAETIADFERAPGDNPRAAVAFGTGTAVLAPLFFLSFLPPLRTMPGVLWLLGAGVLMGLTVYGHRRAAAYLSNEPGRWDLFRPYRLLNPARYSPEGRRFVRLQIIATVTLAFWWLGVGAFVMSRQQQN
jgi:hypothetical protein